MIGKRELKHVKFDCHVEKISNKEKPRPALGQKIEENTGGGPFCVIYTTSSWFEQG